MRLNKFLSGAGIASRRGCDEIIAQGRVTVNGKVVTSLGTIIDEKKDRVTCDGKPVNEHEKLVYVKLHKPKGYACTNHDEKGRKTVLDLVDCNVRLFCVGRLDYNTEGLIFLTNDGEFANLVTHPKFHFEKEYQVTVEGEMKESELAVLRAGVVENGVRMPKAKVNFLSFDGKNTKVSVCIDEGQNRQVRRMFESIGRTIVLLKRVRIANVRLGGLPRGKWKNLTDEEIASFKVKK